MVTEHQSQLKKIFFFPAGMLGKLILVIFWLAFGLFMACAVWVQLEAGARVAVMVFGGILFISALLFLFCSRENWALFLIFGSVACATLWWVGIKPSNERNWAGDVAHGVTGHKEGQAVTLHNVRNFAWLTDTQFIPRWEQRQYQLDTLVSVDVISSTWSSLAIAHTLVSFGFSDGQRVVFSAEIRREANEEFSEVAGFFKAYELVLIAADERDIIRLRTNMRKESVSLYALDIPHNVQKELFLGFVALGNELAGKPRFYNTLTTNCTTVIFHLGRVLDPALAMDWRILLSGYVPDYLYNHRLIDTDKPLSLIRKQAQISQKGIRAGNSKHYSEIIRQ